MLERLKPLCLFLFACLYAAAIAFSRSLSLGPEAGTPLFWPAAGLYFAFLLVSPATDWWRIAVLALLGQAIGSAISNLPLQVLFVPIWALRSAAMMLGVLIYRQSSSFHLVSRSSSWHAFHFVIIGGVFCPALISIAICGFLGSLHNQSLWEAFRVHFVGSSLGILTVTPFLLSAFRLARDRGKALLSRSFWMNALILFGTLFLALNIFIFDILPESLRYHFMVVPLLVALSFRGSFGLTATSNMIISLIAFYQVIRGQSFIGETRDTLEALSVVQMFVATTTFTQLVLTAAVRKRIKVTQDLDGKSRELERAIRELDQAKKAAVAASEAKSNFLAHMSHEIRTPLNAMLGYAELIADGDEKTLDCRAHARVIRRNGRHLTELLNQILDLSKIEAGQLSMSLAPVRLRDVIAHVRELMGRKAEEKGLVFKVHIAARTPDQITTDELRLRQILINGLSNAIKFTDRGSVTLRVDAFLDEDDRYRAHFAIEDSGIGLDASEAEHLFQAFSQANPSIAGTYGGTGLGLDLSRRLARKLNGDYSLLKSQKGQGSVFLLQLDGGRPLESEALAKPTPITVHEELRRSLDAIQILVVDDSPDTRFLIARFLQQSGAKVDTAENGREALEKLDQGHYDLILMDIEMPEMTGLEALSILRSRHYTGPVIALTGRAMPNEIADCLAAGFDQHLIKPVDRMMLVDCALRHLHELRAGSGSREPVVLGQEAALDLRRTVLSK